VKGSVRFVASIFIVLAFGNLANAWGLDARERLTPRSATGTIASSTLPSSAQVAVESVRTHAARASRVERRVLWLCARRSVETGVPPLHAAIVARRSSSPAPVSVALDENRGRAPPLDASSLNS
jgi:hypothetical protein